jgi:hypothetical protein
VAAGVSRLKFQSERTDAALCLTWQTPATALARRSRGHGTHSEKSPARLKTNRSKRRKRSSAGGFQPLLPWFPSVVHEIKVRRPVGLNGLHHGLERPAVDLIAYTTMGLLYGYGIKLYGIKLTSDILILESHLIRRTL